MTTTVMRNSIVGDNWIYQTAQQVPIQRVIDDKGQLTGEILTGPVRLAFCDLFELPKRKPNMTGEFNPKFGTMALFSPWYEQFGGNILREEYYAGCAEKFADYYVPEVQDYVGLHSPFRKQEEKIKFGGFTPGLMFMTCTSKFKPPIVDVRGNPIVDQAKVYPGVWAILSINRYTYNDVRKKGVAFGLQSVMIIGDDEPLGGGPADPNTSFAVARGNIAAPIVPPNIARNMPSAAGAPAPGGVVPHGMPTGTPTPSYAPAPAPAPAPAAPAPTPGMPYAGPAQDDDAWMRA
jgi:hypothetical protein